jgi:hypothetical protein
VLELWTNEFLQAMNNKAITPTLMYTVENVNFNANVETVGNKETISLQNLPIERNIESFKCILCKDEPSFASKKGLALHVEMAHAHSRETTNEYLKKNIGLSFKEVVESRKDLAIVKEEPELIKCELTNKRPHADDVPHLIGDVSITKKKRRPPPGLIKINPDPEPIMEDHSC